MAKNPYKTAEFRRLQKEWYKKAKDSGFHDIEQGSNMSRYDGTYHNTAQIRNQLGGKERRTVRDITARPSQNYSEAEWVQEAKDREVYYRLLRAHCHKLEAAKAPPHLQYAFEAYSEGVTLTKIIKYLSREVTDFVNTHRDLAIELAQYEQEDRDDE